MLLSTTSSTMRGSAGKRTGPKNAFATTLTILLDNFDAGDLAELLEDDARTRRTRT